MNSAPASVCQTVRCLKDARFSGISLGAPTSNCTTERITGCAFPNPTSMGSGLLTARFLFDIVVIAQLLLYFTKLSFNPGAITIASTDNRHCLTHLRVLTTVHHETAFQKGPLSKHVRNFTIRGCTSSAEADRSSLLAHPTSDPCYLQPRTSMSVRDRSGLSLGIYDYS